MGKNIGWSAEEKKYLEGVWGRVSLPTICRKLNRTERAVKLKAYRMNLGGYSRGGDLISLKQLLLLLGYKDISRGTRKHIINSGFPVKKRRLKKRIFTMVSISEFWEWAGEHRDFFRYDKLEPLILGKEPDWVAEQRHIDFKCKYTRRPWKPSEDTLLEYMINKGAPCHEISERLSRSERAIFARCYYIGIDHPNARARFHWTSDDDEKLMQFWRCRLPLKHIAIQMSRSEISVAERLRKLRLKEAANG